MNPAYTSDKPGVAPDCGMALEPVYADDEPTAATGTTGRRGHRPSAAARRDQDLARTPAVDRREVRHRRTGRRDALDPHGRQGHLRRDARRARAHAHRRLDREGLRRLHRRLREAGPADADDLQPGDAGVAAGAAARRTRARPDARQPAGIGGRARRTRCFEAAKRRLELWQLSEDQIQQVLDDRSSRSTASRCARRPAASSRNATRFRIRRSRPTATCTRSPT